MTSADLSRAKKVRGAYFTPPAIADYLAAWAVGDNPDAAILDPSCGEAAFLLAAARRLRDLGKDAEALERQVFGVDLHRESLREASALLEGEGLDARLIEQDFFDVLTPAQLDSPLPEVDAVIGNPPFVRYQEHRGVTRKKAVAAALAQGVQISGLASSWAALLVHASGFLKPDGRVAMVLPAELLTVHYAEPVRRWLRRRFAAVHLVMFNRLQFTDALENVVLLVAHGSGGCDAFSLYQVEDAQDLKRLRPFDHLNVTPAAEGKWTDVLLTSAQRKAFRDVSAKHFIPLDEYGTPELGTVTGANDYFVLTEAERKVSRLTGEQVERVSPPGTRHLRGLAFTNSDWQELLESGQAVWLLHPEVDDQSPGLLEYVREGEARGIQDAYKCRIRSPWWRVPVVRRPDLFFTYMSHRYPRLIENRADVGYLNSMHGVRLRRGKPLISKRALPLVVLNSLTMLGAELHGRAYGGGILKMEPTEARRLPVPDPGTLLAVWELLRPGVRSFDSRLRVGEWEPVVQSVDAALLRDTLGLDTGTITSIQSAAGALRERRLRS